MPNEMTKDDASRIQSGQAQGGKDMSSSGFAARAQSAGDKDTNAGGGGGNAQGAGQGHGQAKK